MGFFLAAIGIVFVLYVIGGRHRVTWHPDETHYLPLPPGRHLALHRVRTRIRPQRKYPVILCHGLGACRFNMTLPGEHSLAERFRDQGYEVFLPDLSGSGQSVPGNWLTRGRYGVTFDDYVHRDGPAIIRHALAQTGAAQVFWVGHSMGGMLAYALAQQPDTAPLIRGAVAVASPGSMNHIRWLRRLARLDFLLHPFPCLHQRFWTRVAATLLPVLPEAILRPLLNIHNMDPAVTRAAAVNVVDSLPTSLLLQFSGWIKAGRVASADGELYEANLGLVRTPFLLLSGAADRLAPPESVRYAYEHIASEDKTYIPYGLAAGTQADYGHGDIMFGRTAPGEVFRDIVEWVNKRDGGN